MIEWRPHRWSLDDAMFQARSFESFDALREHLREREVQAFGEIEVEPFGFNERNGWDEWVMTAEPGLVLGYTNGDPRQPASSIATT